MASNEDQVAEMKRLASTMELDVVDIIEESKSAKAPGRLLFNKMLKRIKAGDAQGILCWKLNRLARNPVDGGEISWLLQQSIVQHIQTYERDYKPSDNVLMMQVEFGMANQFVRDLSVDVKRGLRHKAERGWYPCRRLPLGYRHNPERIKPEVMEEIKVDQHTFGKLKQLWELLLTGQYSIPEIRHEGVELNLRNKCGNVYCINTYHRIFTNEFYCGYFHWLNDKGERIRFSGKHPAMVTPTEFEKVQVILGNKSRDTRIRSYYFPYRGLITCGECSGHVTTEHKLQVICTSCKTKFSVKTRSDCPKCSTEAVDMQTPSVIDKVYYHCTKNRGDCSQGCATATSLQRTIMEELKGVTIRDEFWLWLKKALKQLSTTESDETKVGTKLKKRETELKNRIDGLISMRIDGDVSREQFHVLNREVETELRRVRQERKQHEDVSANWQSIVEDETQFLLTALRTFGKSDDRGKNDIVSKLASNLTLIKMTSLYPHGLGLSALSSL